ncbi:MAG: glutaredoxin family protein [Gallionellaceae bacterium]|nr:glutaredoxin family protein [Gallionellaceae bacterium]
MTTPQLKLFGTHFCHLCDEAKAIVQASGIKFEYVDIADDDDLIGRYGIHIPVLQRIDSNAELGWPFDAAMFAKWLND